jgi:hypothetical protein
LVEVVDRDLESVGVAPHLEEVFTVWAEVRAIVWFVAAVAEAVEPSFEVEATALFECEAVLASDCGFRGSVSARGW